jgi:hypothetical protein
MTENVVFLRPIDAPPVPPEAAKTPNENLIRFLEQLLQDARSGDVIGAACSYMAHDCRSGYSIVGTVGGFSMQGALQCALQDICDLNRSADSPDDD